MLRRGLILATIGIAVSGIASFSIFVSGEESLIPEWVKNNAKWWSEGAIGESDYVSSLQYLITQGIIKIPITDVQATKVSLSDSDRAQSVVVHMGGEFFEKGVTFYTFSEFFHFSALIETTQLTPTSGIVGSPQFLLGSLVSNDKKDLYALVEKYVNPTRIVTPFPISVDILDGNGRIIQTWDYRRCDITDYTTFLESDKDVYRFGEKDEAEWRDRILFACAGFSLRAP